jgi:aryl-alcohol dehydrogenase-like predicted oxidoreductase
MPPLRAVNPQSYEGGEKAMSIIIGTAALGQAYGGNNQAPSLFEAQEFFEACATAGLSNFDTAPGYGSAEIRTFTFAQGQVDTKISRIAPELSQSLAETFYVNQLDQIHHRALTSAAEVRYIHLHSVDNITSHDGNLFKFHLRAAQRFRRRGVNAQAGVSIYTPEDFVQVCPYQKDGLRAIQLPFNILSREWFPVSFAQAHQAKLIIRSVFLQGLLAKWDLVSWPSFVTNREANQLRQDLGTLQTKLGRDSIYDLCLAFVKGKFMLKTADICIGVNNIAELKGFLLVNKLPPLSPDEVQYVEDYISGIDIPSNLTDPRKWKR